MFDVMNFPRRQWRTYMTFPMEFERRFAYQGTENTAVSSTRSTSRPESKNKATGSLKSTGRSFKAAWTSWSCATLSSMIEDYCTADYEALFT